MKIAILPLDITQGNVEENLISTAERMRFVEHDTDIVVLPELFTTGFVNDAEELRRLAEPDDGHTMDDVRRWAMYFKKAIAGSFMARNATGSRIYNRAFFVEPHGEVTFYDKHHLFNLSGEDKLFEAGEKEPPVIRYMGWNVALAVCFDLRFPGWLRNRGGRYDILLLPANWPSKRQLPWETLLRARAIENQAYVVGANRTGTEGNEKYDESMSMIVDYAGHTISSHTAHGIVHARLHKEQLDEWRKRFPVLELQDQWADERGGYSSSGCLR